MPADEALARSRALDRQLQEPRSKVESVIDPDLVPLPGRKLPEFSYEPVYGTDYDLDGTSKDSSKPFINYDKAFPRPGAGNSDNSYEFYVRSFEGDAEADRMFGSRGMSFLPQPTLLREGNNALGRSYPDLIPQNRDDSRLNLLPSQKLIIDPNAERTSLEDMQWGDTFIGSLFKKEDYAPVNVAQWESDTRTDAANAGYWEQDNRFPTEIQNPYDTGSWESQSGGFVGSDSNNYYFED